MTKRLKKLLVAITIGVVLITAGIISGVCVINASLAKRPTYVSTAEELETAINDDVDKPIVLNNDIVVHGDLNANKLFDLEMNGHDLRVIGKMTLRTSKAGEMYLCDGKTAIKSREKVQADSVEIDAVNATVTWNANVQLKDGYTADDFVVAAADHSFIFNGIMLGAGGQATKTAMTVKQGRVVVAVKDEDVNAPAEIVVPAGANGVLVDNKTDDEVNIKASTSVSVSGNVSIDVDENAEDVKISAKTDSSKVTIKSGTVSSVDASGSEVIVDKGAVVDGKITAGKVENNGTVGEIEAGEIVDNSVAIYKEDKKNELDEYALAKGKDSYTSDNWTAVQLAVTAGKKAIDDAADIAAVDVAFATAKAEIDKVKTAEQEAADALANKKTETLAALEAYAESKGEANYTAENWTAIQSAVTAGKKAIDKAADIAAVDAAFAEAKTAIDAIETVADSLEAYKTTQKAALEAYAESKGEANYTAENWTAIQSAVTAGKEAIAAAANETAVDAAYNAAAANIDAVKTIAQQLADKKAEVIGKLDEAKARYAEADYRAAQWKNITDAYDNAKNGINAVTVITALPGNFVATFTATASAQKTNAQLTAEELAAKKAEVAQSLKAAYDGIDLTLYRETEKNAITAKYEEHKAAVNAVTDIANLPGTFVTDFNAFVATQKTNAQLTAEELAAKKAEVLQNLKTAYDGVDLTLYRETEKNAITAKYEEHKAAINAVTDIANLPGTFVTDFNAFVATQKTNAQLTAEELTAKKAEVIGKLDEAKARYAEADYRAAQWKNITDAYDNAKNGINAVTDIAQLPGNFVSNFTTVAAAQPTAADLDEQELAAYKADKKAALEAYGAGKGQDNYTAENWTAIQDAVTAGQNAIDNAADKTAVDAAFEAANTEIDSVALAKARLDETNYDSFAGALAALTTGEEHTLTLLADVTDTTATEYVFDGVNVTLDLNGHVLDGLAYGGSGATHYIIVKNEAVLTITDGSEAKTGKLTSWYAGNSTLNVIYVENAKVVLNGGTITAHDANYGMVGIMAKANANVEINGGEVQGLYFEANRKRGYAINVAAATATLTVNGGVLSTDDPYCYAINNTVSGSTVSVNGGTIATISIAKNTIVSITGGTFKSAVKPDYLTKGYACLENEDGTYRVESGYVVTVGSVKYDTLSAAIAAANTGDVIKVYDDITENEGNIKYIIRKALTISGAYGATGVKPVIKGTFAVDINGISDGSDVVTIENLEIVHNGVYVKDGWTQDTKGAVVLQDGGITLKNNYIHLVDPAPANVSNSPSGLQLSRRGASVSTGAITVSGNTFGAYPKYSDKTNTIATAIQVTRNYTLSGVLVYGGLEVDDEKIYTGNKYENTDGNAQYVLYGNFDFAADKRGYTYVVFGDVFAYNRDGGDLLAGGKMIIARSFTLTDKVYDVKAGTELVIESGATLNGNGLTLNVYGTLTVKGKIENTNIVYGDDASRTIYLDGSEVDDSTVFDENAEYVVDINRSTDAGAFTIAAAAKVKKMTINLKLYSGNLNITDAITVVSPIVVNGYGAVKNTAKKTPFNVTADTAFIVKSGSLELNKIELKHTGTSEDEKNFIVADVNANVTVDLATVAFVATADNTCFFNVASGATCNLNFVDDGSTFKVNTSTMVATADVFTVTKVEDGADYVGADYYGNNFAAHNRDAYSTVNVTDKNGNSLFNIENAIVTKGDETPTYYVATGAGLKTAITSGADYVKLMDDVVGSGESDTDVTVTAKTGDLETVIDLNGKQFGYELNLSTIILNDAKKYEDTGYTLKVTIKNGKIGTESGYNQDAVNGRLYYGVLCQGNGVFLTLENVESSAYYGGLYANGAWKDNVITATDCKFASTIAGCGAYLPGKNTYNFTNCTFSGSVGVYIKSGDATFTDCTIEGKGEYLKPTYNGNGADGEGSGLVVDSTTGYQTPMTVTVNGGSITSANGYAIEEVSNAKDNADKICYSTVTVSKETVLTGKLGRVYSENGTVMVEDESGVKTAYASTAAGVAKAMANGGTVVLTNDVVATTKADSELPIKAQYGNIETVIDLNGKALGYELQLMNTIDGKSTDYTLKVTIKNGKLGSQTANGKFSDGSRHEYGILMQGDKVDLTLENVEVTAFYAGLYGNGQYVGSEITATKCTFNGKNACSMYMPANYTSVFTDCTFSGTVYLKSGNTTFNNCVIDDTIVGEHKAPVYNASGSTGWGSGVIVDSCYGYQQPMIVKFNGGSIKSALGYAIEEASTAPAGKDKVSYATVTVSKKTVLEGALGEILSENETVIKEQA